MRTNDSDVRRTVNLRAELKRWRTRRQLSLRALAHKVSCDFSHLGKIETGKTSFTRAMAEACDHALDAGGALIAAWVNAHSGIRPAQLPATPGRIVGRDAELAMLTAMVDAGLRDRHRPSGTPSVIAIDGPAGAGKTALALRWAHEIAGRFVDGQLYADLHGFAPTHEQVTIEVVLEEFLAALSATAIPDTTRERAALYRSLLADRRVLIVLDNVADAGDIEHLLPGSAGCAVVVTSRRILSRLAAHRTATRITLGPLAEPDSLSLVTHLIGTDRADAEPAATTALTRLCGHLPLALRVVAEHVATYPHRSVADLTNELTDNHNHNHSDTDHDDTGNRLAIAETDELPAAFSWTYHHLAPDTARVFRLIGLHPGPQLSVAAIAALADLTPPQARRQLRQLAALHLITIESDHVIRLHELTRVYARDLAATHDTPDDRRRAIRRLAAWYLTAVDAASHHLLPHDTPARAPRTPPARAGDPDALSAAHSTVDAHAVFADERAARVWCDAELRHYRALLRMALAHDPDRTAPQLAAELGRIGLLHQSRAHPGQPAHPPSTPRVDPAADAGRCAPHGPPSGKSSQTNAHTSRPTDHRPPDRCAPADRLTDCNVSTDLAHPRRDLMSGSTSSCPARSDHPGDADRDSDPREEESDPCAIDDSQHDREQDDRLMGLLQDATAQLFAA